MIIPVLVQQVLENSEEVEYRQTAMIAAFCTLHVDHLGKDITFASETGLKAILDRFLSH